MSAFFLKATKGSVGHNFGLILKEESFSFTHLDDTSYYRTSAIITHGLYIYDPIFEVHFFLFKEGIFRKFCPYVWLIFKSGFKSRVGYDGARTGIYKLNLFR